ncbi:hypothetical protein [Nocardioides sp. SYSU DS0651]|uniref:hypothetical protein n=1 Tax=Nocardioides sp. SYSU DS0651 TaxID=3415955 RepID=UPI003F4C1194
MLHVGPGKTGTTALQSAFHHNRAVLAGHGVHYPGGGRQPWTAANQALTLSPERPDGPLDRWHKLLEEIESAGSPRTVISSEAFARADRHAAAAVVEALGRDRVHVVLTMRPPADLLSSNWWQSVAGGGRRSYVEWLEAILKPDDAGNLADAAFWFRTRFDTIAARWAEIVGPENVTAVSLAGQPRDFVLRVFEQLTALPEGILVPGPGESNASLAHPVAEMIRQFYAIRRREGLGRKGEVDQIRGAALNMLRRDTHLLTGEEPIRTPRWAVEAASEVAHEINRGLLGLGINIVGDLEPLTVSSRPAPDVVETPRVIPIADAAALLHEMVRSAHLHEKSAVAQARKDAARRGNRRAASREGAADEIGGREALRVLASKAKRRLTGR